MAGMSNWKNPIRLEHTQMPSSDHRERHIFLFPPTESGGPYVVQSLSQPGSLKNPDGLWSEPSFHPTHDEANARVDELKKQLEAAGFHFGLTEERP
jgi:hypothetical protein